MTTMLERAARAVGSELGFREEAVATPGNPQHGFAVKVARAVLMAVRELPDEIIDEHLYDNECGYAMYYEGWQPAIDAILKQEPAA